MQRELDMQPTSEILALALCPYFWGSCLSTGPISASLSYLFDMNVMTIVVIESGLDITIIL